MKRMTCLAALFVLSLWTGCAEKAPPPAPPAATPAVTQTPTAPPIMQPEMPAERGGKADDEKTDTTPTAPTKTVDSTPTQPAKTTPAKSSGPTQVKWNLNLVADDYLFAAVAHPKRMLASSVVTGLVEQGALSQADIQQALQPLSESTGLDAAEMEEVAIFVSRKVANSVGREMGLPVGDDGSDAPAKKPIQLYTNNMKQIALAFHNYHDTYRRFPKAGGPAEESDTIKDGLSWRVHLLPFFEQFELYQEFHLDEPWDSEHNKTLIEKMPEIFAVPGVEEAGQTSIHVFTSAGAPFADNAAPSIANFTDGTSNTLLFVSAGANKADVWTKPGGLELDADDPLACLGELTDDKFLAALTDGSVRTMSRQIGPEVFTHLVTKSGGEVVPFDAFDSQSSQGPAPFGLFGVKPEQAPVIAVIHSASLDSQEVAQRILGETEDKQTDGGQAYYFANGWGVAFPSDTSLVCSGEAQLIELLGKGQAESSGQLASQLRAADQPFDVLVAVDLTSHKEVLQALSQQNPLLGPFANIETLTLTGNVTGAAGDPLLALLGTSTSPQTAQTLAAMVNGLALNQVKMLAAQSGDDPSLPEEAQELRKMLQPGLQKLEMTAEGNSLKLAFAIPEGFDRLPTLLAPALLQAREAAKKAEKRNAMKQFGLAFHNYHDVFGTFPRAGGQGGTLVENKQGLSWRVHLLPYLDQAPLYNQFHLDEPWDSDHNKQFIEQMPAIFQVDGVEDPTKTSIHVFTGPGAPFADDQAAAIRNFTDGTSNTLLAVVAGPNTAEIWTKPGGLDFDPEDPFKALGDIGETFLGLMGDGAVRSISAMLEPATLRKLIQQSDGEPVGEF